MSLSKIRSEGPLEKKLRADIRQRMGTCKTCGHPSASMRDVAKACGLSVSTISRFLGGKELTLRHAEHLMRWLAKEPKRPIRRSVDQGE